MSAEPEARAAAFAYVDRVTAGGEQPITWHQLRSFTYGSEPIHLASQQGIFKPRQLSFPISIRTTPPPLDGPPPYQDEMSDDGYLTYAYRGTDPNHYQNKWLRAAMENGISLLYLEGVAEGLYDAHGAIIEDDDPGALRFRVALLPIISLAHGSVVELGLEATQRRYYMRQAKVRANQHAFRQRVLVAYKRSCSVCRLRHESLLDAAHIVPYADGGLHEITNGLAMCKIHHAAYDQNILGVTPDMQAEIREDVLDEVDGPMLKHGLQEVHGAQLIVPRRQHWRPDREALERRYKNFRRTE